MDRSPDTEAVLINTSGGLTGGDRLSWEVCVGAGCDAVITSQAFEKIYRSTGKPAVVETRLSAAAGSSVAWLPQETILFDQGRLERSLDIEMAKNARVLICEAVIFGRTARNEIYTSGSFVDRWRIVHDGALVHREDMRVSGDTEALLDEEVVLGGRKAMATVLLCADGVEDLVQPVRNCTSNCADIVCGVSAWRVGETGKLLARIAAGDGYDLRKALVPLLEVLSPRAGVPKVWSI